MVSSSTVLLGSPAVHACHMRVSSGAYPLRSTTRASYRSTAGACILLRSTIGASPSLHASVGVMVNKEASARQLPAFHYQTASGTQETDANHLDPEYRQLLMMNAHLRRSIQTQKMI
ncbi:hypothetical protein YC2023_002869 [Brassica napus]